MSLIKSANGQITDKFYKALFKEEITAYWAQHNLWKRDKDKMFSKNQSSFIFFPL